MQALAWFLSSLRMKLADQTYNWISRRCRLSNFIIYLLSRARKHMLESVRLELKHQLSQLFLDNFVDCWD